MTWAASAWGDKPLGWEPPASGGGPTYTLSADSAALTLAGQDAALTAQRRLAADSAALTLAGQDATLTYSGDVAARVGSFEYRIVPMVRHKTLLQRIRESRPIKVKPVKQKVRKKASVIEVRAAQLAIDDGSEAEFRALMDQWVAQKLVIPEAAGVDQYAIFMAQVALQIKQIEQDDEDAVLTLLLC